MGKMTNTLQHLLQRTTAVIGLGMCVFTASVVHADAHTPELPLVVYPPVVISDAARWYQVNVLIFSQNTVIERNPELWPNYPTVDRSVPPITLINPPVPEVAIDPLLSDPFALDGSVFTEEALADIDTPFYGLDETPVDTAIMAQEPEQSSPSNTLTIATTGGPLLVRPYEKLPETERYLLPYADRLERDRRYKILFHESWIQPIESSTLARPIVVTGGFHSGLLDELSGLINISISRYLHVNTQLYLTDIVESSDPFDLLTGQKYAFVPLTFSNPQSTGDASSDLLSNRPEFDEMEPFVLKGITSGTAPIVTDVPDYFDIPATYAVAVSSVLMQEKRRLRSKELHYIDNPKMGMLIYFTPFDIDAEPLDELAPDDGDEAIDAGSLEETVIDVVP